MKNVYLFPLLFVLLSFNMSMAQEKYNVTFLRSNVKHNSPALSQDVDVKAMYAMPELLRNLGSKSAENPPVCNLLTRHKAINDGAYLWAPLGVSVGYKDNSTGEPVSWLWNIPGAATPLVETQNADAVYIKEGLYDMPTLSVTYGDGTSSSYTPEMSMTSSGGVEKIKTGGTVEITTVDMRRHDNLGGLDADATYCLGGMAYGDPDVDGYVGGTNNKQVEGWGNFFMIAQNDAYLDGVNIYLHHKPTKYKEGAQIVMQVWLPSITEESVFFTYLPLEATVISFEDFKADGEDGAWCLTYTGAVANIKFDTPVDLYGKPYFFISIEGFSQDPSTEDFCLLADMKGVTLDEISQYNLLAHNSFGRFDGEYDYLRPISSYGGGNGSFLICPIIRSGIKEADAVEQVTKLPSFDAGVYNGNIVIMSAEACNVAIYDISGKMVMTAFVHEGENILDTQSLKSGIYIVRASNGNALKIIK